MTPATAVEKARRFRLRQVGPMARIAAGLIAFLLGIWGFGAAYADHGGTSTLSENAFKSLRLIVGHFPDDLDGKPLPVALHIARWALPLLTAWSTVALAWLTVRNPVRVALIRARGEHLVLAGDEGLAARTAAAELRAGHSLLLWSPDPRANWVRDAGDEGAAIVEAKGETLGIEGLGLDRARGLLLVGADDTANIALASAVLDEAARIRPAGDPLDVITRVDDLDLRRSVEARFERADRATARIRFASIPDIAARMLFVEGPLDRFVRIGDTARRVFILGFSPVVERYMLRLLAGGHFRDGGKPQFIVVDPQADAQESGFRARNPGADTLAPVLFRKGAIDQPAFARALLDDLTAQVGAPIAILIDQPDEARALALALAVETWYRRLDAVCPPIHVRMESGAAAQLGVALFPFGAIDSLADPERLLQEKHDVLARSIHDFYLEGRLDEGDVIGARGSMHEWEDLSESFRDDNRLVADCYQLKLRDIGARLAGGSGPTLRLEGAELEELSRAEHDRWMAAKLSTGWVYGPVRDDKALIHPDIIPYDDLSERIKDLDREQVRIMTRLLAASGQRPLRVLRIGIGAGQIAAGIPALLQQVAAHYPDRVLLFLGLFAQEGSRAALVAAQGAGALIQIAATTNIEAIIDALPAAERAPARAVARAADSLFALPVDTDGDAFIAARSDLLLTGDDAPQASCPIVRVAPDGTIRSAPWAR